MEFHCSWWEVAVLNATIAGQSGVGVAEGGFETFKSIFAGFATSDFPRKILTIAAWLLLERWYIGDQIA